MLLLALFAAPVAREALAATDSHRCCPESAPAAEAPMPCQYVAPMGCCALLAVPATAAGDEPRMSPAAFAFVGPAPLPASPSAPSFAQPRIGHGPPQAPYVRTIVLRL